MSTRTLPDRLHGPTAANVPQWAIVSAYLVHLAVLPSCIWRIAGMVFDVPVLEAETEGRHTGQGPQLIPDSWTTVYVIGLSVISEGLAFLAFGLVCRWGEVFPRWVPRLRGRRVPIMGAVIPAAIGSTLLLVFPYAMFMDLVLGRTVGGASNDTTGMVTHGWQTVAFAVSYLPLVAWGPLLGALTVHYYRRRRPQTQAPTTESDGNTPFVAAKN
ncbi:hypothetical protein [Flexivirga sp. B27]